MMCNLVPHTISIVQGASSIVTPVIECTLHICHSAVSSCLDHIALCLPAFQNTCIHVVQCIFKRTLLPMPHCCQGVPVCIVPVMHHLGKQHHEVPRLIDFPSVLAICQHLFAYDHCANPALPCEPSVLPEVLAVRSVAMVLCISDPLSIVSPHVHKARCDVVTPSTSCCCHQLSTISKV